MNLRLSRTVGSLLLFVLVFAAAPAQAGPNFGRFLRDPADSSIVYSYGNASPTTFDLNVFCDNLKIGELKFDYDTYLSKPDGTAGGGGALSGGFYLSAGNSISPGHHLAWVQTVISTRTGANDWGIDPATGPFEFPDATRTSPEYPFTTTAATPPNPPGPPTLAYQDFPNRFFADGAQSWLAELALVCIDERVGSDGFTQAYVIGSFLWGFGVEVNPNKITLNAPHLWGAPTASFLATLNNYYDGAPPNPPTSGGTSSKYRFQPGCDACFVPEPNSIVLLGSGAVLVLFLRRGRLKKTLAPN